MQPLIRDAHHPMSSLLYQQSESETGETTFEAAFPIYSTPSGLCAIAWLVPDTPRPVVRHGLLPLGFQLLHRIIQKEVDQDGVHFGFRVLPPNLSPDEFHAPNAAG